jgi:hypothetical protein
MGREFIGECLTSGEDPEFNDYEMELAIKYIEQECGQPPCGVNVQVTLEDHELGSYPTISVIWDDSVTGCPDEYIGKCVEAFERFVLPEEIYQTGRERMRLIRELYADMEKWFEPE